ncbi:carboxymuconolactone decarboxylase family protein [Natronorubrum sp. FCH18a]|uniref:carboxymuconolactone decarboxylase family protein n=1 Tax=Natronorubrum sp. FCH18a TaxID=3447018 RepID=UPI003F50D588
MARVPLRTQSELPDDYQYLLSDDAMGEIHLLCAMANNPDALQSYMRYGSTLWSEGGLEPADLERCILTIARALDAEYEWHQHVPIARECGVSEDELLAIARDDLDVFDERRAALLRYARAVVRDTVDDDCFEAVADHFEESTVVGITLVATHYLATARFLSALEIPLEESFVGWELDGDR